ncbi:oxytocin receptor-like [Penaeus vannamei]|uniref:oxytocin receptor-like n=1 Tax=Penaeus vannamei TaxID=6689 RepID=UPI00387F59D0
MTIYELNGVRLRLIYELVNHCLQWLTSNKTSWFTPPCASNSDNRYLISEDLKANKLKHGNGYAVLRRSMPNSKSLSRAKIKTVKMTFCIILTFVACWTPYFVVHNIRIWSDYRYKISQPVIVFAETMALVNSVLNPILYGCFNLRMKQGLKDVCCRGSSMERNVCINSAFHSRYL